MAKRGRPKEINRVVTKTSQSGLREGLTRATFIIREDTLDKLKERAYTDRKKLKDLVSEALDYYLNIGDQYDPDYFYIKDSKNIEDVVKYLYARDTKPTDDMARTVLDLMRMSENWYGRLQEANKIIEATKPTKEK